VIVVAADSASRNADRGELETSILRKLAGEQGALDFECKAQLGILSRELMAARLQLDSNSVQGSDQHRYTGGRGEGQAPRHESRTLHQVSSEVQQHARPKQEGNQIDCFTGLDVGSEKATSSRFSVDITIRFVFTETR